MPSLNNSQSLAASHVNGPMLVLAGPGSGKTATLVARYRKLVMSGVQPGEILCVTFTKDAATEMKGRISRITNVPKTRIAAATFHSFCNTIIKRHPEKFSDLASRKLVSDGEMAQFFSEAGKRLPDKDLDLEGQISLWKDRLVSPEGLKKIADSAELSERDQLYRIAQVYEEYQRELDIAQAMDFGDMIFAVVKLLDDDDEFRRYLSQKFRFVMCDEYQDVNLAQSKLLDHLASEHGNLWVVGDDDQSLYGWRGSDIDYILSFHDRYDGAKTVELTENYRSTPEIIGVANTLIKNNEHRKDKHLSSNMFAGHPVELHSFTTPSDEASWIADKVADHLAKGVKPTDIAILCRTAHELTEIQRKLESKMIPVQIQGGMSFWQLPEIKVALKAIAFQTGEFVSQYGDSIPTWLAKRVKEVGKGRFPDVAARICTKLLSAPPKSLDDDRKADWIDSLEQLRSEVLECSSGNELRLRIRESFYQKRSTKPVVTLSSIHASKGLEWSIVFSACWEQDILPHKKNNDLEEERRLAFVAVTRAKHRLYISHSAERKGKESEPSIFVDEVLVANEDQHILGALPDERRQVITVRGHEMIKSKGLSRHSIKRAI